MCVRFLSVALLITVIAAPAFAQLSPAEKWAAQVAAQYQISANGTRPSARQQYMPSDTTPSAVRS